MYQANNLQPPNIQTAAPTAKLGPNGNCLPKPIRPTKAPSSATKQPLNSVNKPVHQR